MDDDGLPLLPGFRDMALRRMAEQRASLVRSLVAQRQAAGLSQTEVAARMGTSQSAVARLESGATDVRASTLERYAAAVGGEIHYSERTVESVEPERTFPMRASARFPGEFPRPGGPEFPGRPPAPSPDPGPVPPSRVWIDPHTAWQDTLYERLLEKRIVLASGILDDDAATRLSAQLLTLDAEGDGTIRLELQNLRAELSPVLTVMGVLDVVRAPVHAYASGETAGAALGLLASCPCRVAYPNASFTLSEPRLEFGGTVTAVTAREQQARRMADSLYYRIAEATGREADEIREDARRGRTLTTAEAIGYGLITERADKREI
ncbi:MAG TPA: XRE family transcriptional regulator [Trebonia sp.]